MKTMRKMLLLVLVLAVGHVSAQKKWNYNFGLGGSLKSGNVNTFTLNNNGGVDRNDSTLAFSADYAIVYGEKDNVEYDKGLTANVKFDLFQYSRWSPFFSASYINNKWKGYNYKTSLLLGAKYRIFSNAKCDYSISAAYVYDFVEYTKSDDALKPQVSRISLRAKIKQKLGDAATLKHTTFYQPSLMDFGGDYMVNSVTSVETKLSAHVFFDVNFSYEYRSLVPEGIKNEDIATSVSLKLKF